jgi:hypothetical protein
MNLDLDDLSIELDLTLFMLVTFVGHRYRLPPLKRTSEPPIHDAFYPPEALTCRSESELPP